MTQRLIINIALLERALEELQRLEKEIQNPAVKVSAMLASHSLSSIMEELKQYEVGRVEK